MADQVNNVQNENTVNPAPTPAPEKKSFFKKVGDQLSFKQHPVRNGLILGGVAATGYGIYAHENGLWPFNGSKVQETCQNASAAVAETLQNISNLSAGV